MFLYLLVNFIFGFGIGFFTSPNGVGANGLRFPFEPSFTPPSWVFAFVWSCIYVGTAYMCYVNDMQLLRSMNDKLKFNALFTVHWLLQNAWPLVFFGFKEYDAGAFIICVLIITLLMLNVPQDPICKGVARAYLAWLSFALLLNIAAAVASHRVEWRTWHEDVCKGSRFGALWCHYARH